MTRILRVKLRDGLFEKGRPSSRPLANKVALLGAPEHRAVAREAVRKSLVLLKNDGACCLCAGKRMCWSPVTVLTASRNRLAVGR